MKKPRKPSQNPVYRCPRGHVLVVYSAHPTARISDGLFCMIREIWHADERGFLLACRSRCEIEKDHFFAAADRVNVNPKIIVKKPGAKS